MMKIRYVFILLGLLLSPAAYSDTRVSIGIGLPNASIGINLPIYPELVVVPGYPVYYAPQLQFNFFFYDGLYWIYQDDNWYASSWYNGPWWFVDSVVVPVFILRIPVRYYLRPPVYFRGWQQDAPPRWGDHWGHDWERRRGGWDKWNQGEAPPPAPLPHYQRQYLGDRYPRQVEQQQDLHRQLYRYQPSDPVVRQHYQDRVEQRAPGQRESRGAPDERRSRQQDIQRTAPRQQEKDATRNPKTRQEQKERQKRLEREKKVKQERDRDRNRDRND